MLRPTRQRTATVTLPQVLPDAPPAVGDVRLCYLLSTAPGVALPSSPLPPQLLAHAAALLPVAAAAAARAQYTRIATAIT